MGTILSSRTKEDGKIVYEVLVDYEEALQLKGNINNVHLFSEDVAEIETKMTRRGKGEATTYLLVPKDLRKECRFKGKACCQKIETKTKKWGSSLGIIIPKKIVEEENLEQNQIVRILAVEVKSKIKTRKIFGALKNWKINAQTFKNQIRKEESR